MIDRFGSHDREQVKRIIQRIAPRFSGNTADNGIVEYLVNDGFEVALLESVTPYGVALNDAKGGWAGKRNRRTGELLEGWFTTDGYNAGIEYLNGRGGVHNALNMVDESIIMESENNPLRQRIYIQQISESGGIDDIT